MMQLHDIMDSVELPHTLAHTPEMEILQKLMDFDDRGRYISLNAIANQIRYGVVLRSSTLSIMSRSCVIVSTENILSQKYTLGFGFSPPLPTHFS